jgi:hypothetical protein
MEEGGMNSSTQHQQIKEAVKWELEIVERKTEDRFRELE